MNAMKERKSLATHEEVLEALAAAIDLPDHIVEKMQSRYQAMGRHLDRDGSTLADFGPEISPQGSFLLGTSIRPIGDAEDCDVDLVCLLRNLGKSQMSQARLKVAVGVEIRVYARVNGMINVPVDGAALLDARLQRRRKVPSRHPAGRARHGKLANCRKARGAV